MTADNTAEGHRRRLRERFLKSGLEGFADYEIVELLLSLGVPRRDTKPQAKEAIKRFITLRGVLSASPKELQEIAGVGPGAVFGILLVQAVAQQYLKEKIIDKPAMQSAQELMEYLNYTMRDLKNEVFRVVYLTAQNQIIDTEVLCEGTVNHSAVSPRQVMENALSRHASSLIFVHNHPSGACQPSQSDKDLTRDLVFAGYLMEVKVTDHIIIGNDRYYSFAANDLISQYEMEYLGLKLKR